MWIPFTGQDKGVTLAPRGDKDKSTYWVFCPLHGGSSLIPKWGTSGKVARRFEGPLCTFVKYSWKIIFKSRKILFPLCQMCIHSLRTEIQRNPVCWQDICHLYEWRCLFCAIFLFWLYISKFIFMFLFCKHSCYIWSFCTWSH